MPKAVRFEQYGGPEVLQLVDVERPVAGPGQAVVRMRAAGLNLGESKIRSGLLSQIFPTTFPSGQGSDLAGTIEEIGPGVTGLTVGDEVAGFTDERASHAELVLVEAANLTPKPTGVSWEVAGSMFVAGTTAYAAVRAVGAAAGDTIAIAGASGGVGAIAAQLAIARGAAVVGIASPADHPWLEARGITAVDRNDDDLTERLRSWSPSIDAFIDTVGHGYVARAVEVGIARDRINTVIDFAAAGEYGVKADGNAAASSAAVLAELLAMVAAGSLEVAIARTFPLGQVQDAYRYLESKHDQGKVVLVP